MHRTLGHDAENGKGVVDETLSWQFLAEQYIFQET